MVPVGALDGWRHEDPDFLGLVGIGNVVGAKPAFEEGPEHDNARPEANPGAGGRGCTVERANEGRRLPAWRQMLRQLQRDAGARSE
jgi:hypothetical protein